MGVVHELSRADARRIAVRAQLLAQPRPTDLLDTVRRLALLQADQTSAVAPSAQLVLWSRLGSAFEQEDLQDAVDEQRLVELNGMLRPAEDITLYRAEMERWWTSDELRDYQLAQRDWVRVNNAFREEILGLLRTDGPLPASELPSTCDVPWRSSGWNTNRNLAMMLAFLTEAGQVAVSGGTGRDKLWDLAERVYPDEPPVPHEEALRLRNTRRLAALGIARGRAPRTPSEPDDVDVAGEPVRIEGVRGTWRVDPAYLGQPFSGRTVLLSPLDRLVFDRRRMADLFEFDYQLEMYKPAAKRRWGYWALPILHGDRLVGKVDASADRDVGVFRVHAVHQDAPFGKSLASAVDREISDLANWLELDLAYAD
jgi:uncharacterized protein